MDGSDELQGCTLTVSYRMKHTYLRKVSIWNIYSLKSGFVLNNIYKFSLLFAGNTYLHLKDQTDKTV
jgi:hypothetical protein